MKGKGMHNKKEMSFHTHTHTHHKKRVSQHKEGSTKDVLYTKMEKKNHSSAGNRKGEHQTIHLMRADDALNPGLLRDREGF